MVGRVALLVAGLLVAFGSLVRETPTAIADDVQLQPVEQQVVDLVNRERAQAGLRALSVSSSLVVSARNYAAYMARANFFNHVGPDGSTLASRDQAAGYGTFSFLGENLAAGQTSPETAMSGWLNSPSHRANILSPLPDEIGVGYAAGGSYGRYWVQEFGSRPKAPQAVATMSGPATPGAVKWISPVTSHTVIGPWLTAFIALGGMDNLGQPRSEVIADPWLGGGPAQYFQRSVLDYHAENPEAYRIERRLLADIIYPGADEPISILDGPPGPHAYFPLSPDRPTGLGHFVADYTASGQAIYFKEYFDHHGGVDAFGYPKEEPKLRDGLWTQRFQAAVFEYHAENDRDGLLPETSIPYRNYRVQLRLLGDEYVARYGLPLR